MIRSFIKSAGVIGIVVAIIVVVLLFPLAYIWALNTLFPALAIPLSFDTWLAAVILAGLFHTTISKKD